MEQRTIPPPAWSGRVRDEPSGEEREHPLDEELSAVSYAEELLEVVHPPDRPSREASQDETAELCEFRPRLRAAERDEVALPVIAERQRRLAAHEGREVPGRRRRLEDSHLRELRQSLAAAFEIRRVAESQDIVAATRPEPIVDEDAAILGLGEIDRGDERVRFHSAGPHNRQRAELRAGFRMHDAGTDLREERVQEDADAPR